MPQVAIDIPEEKLDEIADFMRSRGIPKGNKSERCSFAISQALKCFKLIEREDYFNLEHFVKEKLKNDKQDKTVVPAADGSGDTRPI